MRGKVVFRAYLIKFYFQTSFAKPSPIFEREARKKLAKRSEKFDSR